MNTDSKTYENSYIIKSNLKMNMPLYVCFICIFIFMAAMPAVILIYKGPDFITMSSESIAYRYFFHERIAHHDEGLPVIWQGYTTLLLQKISYAYSEIIGGDIYQKINNFSLFYLILITAALISLLIYLSCARGDWAVIAIFAPLFMAIYLPQTGSGIYYYTAPDYYATSDLIVTVCIVFSSLIINSNKISKYHFIFCGLILGFALANKVSLAPIALTPILAGLMVSPSLNNYFIGSIYAISLSFIFCAFIYLLSYNFNLYSASKAFSVLLFSNLSGGINSINLSKFLSQYLAFNDLGASFVLALILLLLGVINYFFNQNLPVLKKIIFLLFFIIWLIFEFLFIVIRPAGTTIYECLFSLSALAGFTAAISKSSKLIKVSLLTILSVTLYYLPSNLGNFKDKIDLSNNHSIVLKAFTHELKSFNGEIFIFFPDNSYLIGTLEETLLKAASDFPTWSITGGKKMLERIYPGLHIITGLSAENIYIPSRSTMAWISKDYEGMLNPIDIYPLIKNVLSARRSECNFLDFSSKEKLHFCRVLD